MTDRIRTVSEDVLAMHRESFAFAAQQQELAQKQLSSAFDIGRASLEATRDLQAKMARNWLDAVLGLAEKKEAAKA